MNSHFPWRQAFAIVAILGLLTVPAFAQMATPDPSAMAGLPLPAGDVPDASVTVRVLRERMGNNISGQLVTLRVGTESRTATTDAQGRAQFSALPAGASVQASTTVDGEVLTSQEFPVPARGGIRVALISGIQKAADAEKAAAAAAAKEPARPGVVEFGPESRLIFEFQNDTLTVFYLLEVVNSARTPIDIGGPILMELPTGASGVSMMPGSSPTASVSGDILTITGPFAPGKTSAQVGFSLPQVGAASTIQQKWPIALAQLFVAAEKVGAMQMSSPQLTDTREMTSDGQQFIMGTGGRINAGETVSVNLSGMPAQSRWPRNVALGVAALVFAVGLWMAVSPQAARAAEGAKLETRRERLLSEVVALERKRRQKPLAAADETRLQRLTSDLEKVMAALDLAPNEQRL
ncbi:MAG: hypothetical protein EXQ51_09995 [Acidobacteria bacterium]|nr:hypothetical protein [Acidobacteriota bacterium]